jgi:hypothetical protein
MTDQEFEKFHIAFKKNPSCFVSVIHELTDEQLSKLLNGLEMSPEQKESQRRSFVYGTTKLANSEITEELVNEVGDNHGRRTR